MKIYIKELGQMTNMAAMPIYSKSLKKCSPPVPIDHDIETWYAASCV